MQSQEYLVAHSRMMDLEAENARLLAQVEELQGDVSRLTIENEQLKAGPAVEVPADEPTEKPAKKSRK